MRQSPTMRNDRSTRLDLKDKLKKRIEIKMNEEVKDKDAPVESDHG